MACFPAKGKHHRTHVQNHGFVTFSQDDRKPSNPQQKKKKPPDTTHASSIACPRAFSLHNVAAERSMFLSNAATASGPTSQADKEPGSLLFHQSFSSARPICSLQSSIHPMMQIYADFVSSCTHRTDTWTSWPATEVEIVSEYATLLQRTDKRRELSWVEAGSVKWTPHLSMTVLGRPSNSTSPRWKEALGLATDRKALLTSTWNTFKLFLRPETRREAPQIYWMAAGCHRNQ